MTAATDKKQKVPLSPLIKGTSSRCILFPLPLFCMSCRIFGKFRFLPFLFRLLPSCRSERGQSGEGFVQKSPLSLSSRHGSEWARGIMHNQAGDTPVISPLLEVSEQVPTRQRTENRPRKKEKCFSWRTSNRAYGIKISRSERFWCEGYNYTTYAERTHTAAL